MVSLKSKRTVTLEESYRRPVVEGSTRAGRKVNTVYIKKQVVYFESLKINILTLVDSFEI